MHDFCEQNQVPCLFPVTDLPVIDEQSFYTVYLSQGMTLEADAIARHLFDDGLLSSPVVQVYRAGDPRGEAAAAQLRRRLEQEGGRVTDLRVTDAAVLTDDFWRSALGEGHAGTAVLWLDPSELAGLWNLDAVSGAQAAVPVHDPVRHRSRTDPDGDARPGVLGPSLRAPGQAAAAATAVHGLAQGKTDLRAGRAAGASRRLFRPEDGGSAVVGIRGFFLRDYLLERIEHLIDRASYTGVYPRISLAPGQRFISRSAYIARFPADATGAKDLTPVTDWAVPGSN